ncbi:MAG: hypothetical protein D3909_00785 [Candidatus Electrothrix sp. ATG1]|nr:hypothetical protein [Candidatus Electrothrix sp. ATG1]
MENEYKKYECKECDVVLNEKELTDDLLCPKCSDRLSLFIDNELELINDKKITLFNRGWFDRKDPSERIGQYLSCFSLYQVYNDVKDLKKIKENIYDELLKNINNNTPDYIKTSLVEFADLQNKHVEGERKYIVIERETPRKTQAKILIRFLELNDKLYLGIDSYILGKFSLWEFIKRLLLTYFVLAVVNVINIPFFFIAAFIGKMALFNLYLSGFSLFIGVFMWIDVIRGFLHHKRCGLAFRQCFNKIPDAESFNTDDIFMFFKGILPIVVSTIKTTFKENDIEYNTLDDFLVSVTNTNNMQTIINNASNQGVQGMKQHGDMTVKNSKGGEK